MFKWFYCPICEQKKPISEFISNEVVCMECSSKCLPQFRVYNPQGTILNSVRARAKRKEVYCSLTHKDIRFLWNRDKGYQMQKPYLYRINKYRNYNRDNCEFIEKRKTNNRDVSGSFVLTRIKNDQK